MNREFNEYVFKMGFNGRIDSETRAFIKLYRQKYSSYKRDDIPLVPWLAKKCKVSVRSVYRLIKEPVGDRKDKEKKGGRKRILSTRTENRLIRNINKMRHMNKNWIVRDLMAFCDIDHVSERTVQRILNENGYGYRHARRKGVLTKKDPTKRIKFAKEFVGRGVNFWREEISFYFDGVGFVHKTRPMEDAMSCRRKVWRKQSEGLHFDCTAKGAKTGNNGKQAKFFVAISYNRGVILAEQYTALDGETFADFVNTHFEQTFLRSAKTKRVLLQDGDPSQNSVKAKKALKDAKFTLFPIPPRSPELNPIENVFALVKKNLMKQVIDCRIERESFDEFSSRVKSTLYSTSTKHINNMIDSYGERLRKLISKKGCKIEY